MNIRNLYLVAALCSCTAVDGADTTRKSLSMNAAASKSHNECVLVQRTFFRLAELRDAQMEENAAARQVSQWAAELGGTGSHVKANLSDFVRLSAAFVFKQPRLGAAALSEYGLRSCQLRALLAKTPPKAQLADELLLKGSAKCQQVYPSSMKRDERISACIRREAEKIIGHFRS